MLATLLALIYASLYPDCTVSVFAFGMKGGPGFVALHDFPNTWSTCPGFWPKVRREFGRDILVEVCQCRGGKTP